MERLCCIKHITHIVSVLLTGDIVIVEDLTIGGKMVIETMRITFKNKRRESHTTLNLESFWEIMGNKNITLLEIGRHVQYYEKLY
jgi:hypothetical protein